MRFVSGRIHLGLALAGVLVFGSLVGCSAPLLTVELPGFGDGDVDGIWLWREQGGAWQRACRFELSDPLVQDGAEVVEYQQTCSDGLESPVWRGTLQRDPANPAAATLVMLFRPSGAPWDHKASSYSASGESGLSSTKVRL